MVVVVLAGGGRGDDGGDSDGFNSKLLGKAYPMWIHLTQASYKKQNSSL